MLLVNLNPISLIDKLLATFFIYLIIGYQIIISPLLPHTCKFYPTCSQYGIVVLKRYGFIKGVYKLLKRVLMCNPYSEMSTNDVDMGLVCTDNPLALSKVVIDVSNIVHNYDCVKSLLTSKTDIACVLKANAYGLGSAKIGEILYGNGCRNFFVATPGEGIEIRSVIGEDANVYILCGLLYGAEDVYVNHNLTPVLNTIDEIKLWHNFKKNKECVLQVDTGMSRNGISVAELCSFTDFIKDLNVSCVISHLACDGDKNNNKNNEQLRIFKNVKDILGNDIRYSLAASSGVFLGPEYHFDMVRIGAALYGFVGKTVGLKDVVKVYARILQIRTINKGDTIGYDATFTAEHDMVVATIGIGYADGLTKQFANKYRFYCRGCECYFVGKISMDYGVIDISNIPDGEIRVNDFVEMMPIKLLADELCTNCGNITSQIGNRVLRVYC